jgi:hypothetical protein
LKPLVRDAAVALRPASGGKGAKRRIPPESTSLGGMRDRFAAAFPPYTAIALK